MHVICRGYGFLNLCNLFGTLDAALLHAGQREFHRGKTSHSVVLDAEQLAQLSRDVGTVGGYVVEVLGRGQFSAQRVQVARVAHTHAGRQLLDARQRPCPDDVVYVVVVGEDIVLAVVAVYHAHEVFALKPEEIQECAVLTEPIGIVFVVARGFVVARNDDDAVAHVFAQLLAAFDISLFLEHGCIFFLI